SPRPAKTTAVRRETIRAAEHPKSTAILRRGSTSRKDIANASLAAAKLPNSRLQRMCGRTCEIHVQHFGSRSPSTAFEGDGGQSASVLRQCLRQSFFRNSFSGRDANSCATSATLLLAHTT